MDTITNDGYICVPNVCLAIKTENILPNAHVDAGSAAIHDLQRNQSIIRKTQK
jgi:hypothetical protein